MTFQRNLLLRLLDVAAEESGVTVADLRSRRRKKKTARTRFAIMLAAKEQGRSYSQIGRFFGYSDHSGPYHGAKRAYELAELDLDYNALLGALRREARSSPSMLKEGR
jgi:chromosomal replication initiation ATPase DnaA